MAILGLHRAVLVVQPTRRRRSPASSHFFFLRFVAFVGVALLIKKSSSFLPSLIAATNHLGVAPRPAHSSPDGPLYLAATFRPFNVLPRMPRATLPPSDATELPSASTCRSRAERYPVNA